MIATAALALFTAEKHRPLRQQTQDKPRRTVRNLAMGAMSMALVAVLQRPIVDPLSQRVAERRWGVAQALPLPGWARDALAFSRRHDLRLARPRARGAAALALPPRQPH